MGTTDFRLPSPTNFTTFNWSPKIVTGDYVGNPCSNQIWCKSAYGRLLANAWNITILFIPSFENLPTGQTVQRIFALNGTNYAESSKDVHFAGFIDTAAQSRGQFPPKSLLLGAWVGVFNKPNAPNIKTLILSKLLHRSQPNFAQWQKLQSIGSNLRIVQIRLKEIQDGRRTSSWKVENR